MFKAPLRISDPDAAVRGLVHLFRGQPHRRDFLLARIAHWIREGVKRKKSSGVCNPVTDFVRDGGLIRNVSLVAPHVNSRFGKSIQQWFDLVAIGAGVASESTYE